MKWLENLKTRLADQKPTNLIVRIEDMGWPEFIKDQQRRDLAQRATCPTTIFKRRYGDWLQASGITKWKIHDAMTRVSLGGQWMDVVVTFTRRSQAMLFKLTWGGK